MHFIESHRNFLVEAGQINQEDVQMTERKFKIRFDWQYVDFKLYKFSPRSSDHDENFPPVAKQAVVQTTSSRAPWIYVWSKLHEDMVLDEKYVEYFTDLLLDHSLDMGFSTFGLSALTDHGNGSFWWNKFLVAISSYSTTGNPKFTMKTHNVYSWTFRR